MAGLAGMTENYTEPVSLHLGVSFAVLYRRCTSINMCSHVVHAAVSAHERRPTCLRILCEPFNIILYFVVRCVRPCPCDRYLIAPRYLAT